MSLESSGGTGQNDRAKTEDEQLLEALSVIRETLFYEGFEPYHRVALLKQIVKSMVGIDFQASDAKDILWTIDDAFKRQQIFLK